MFYAIDENNNKIYTKNIRDVKSGLRCPYCDKSVVYVNGYKMRRKTHWLACGM